MLLGTSCGEDTARVETLASSGDPADKSATPELDRIADTLVDLAANDREYVVLVAKVTDYVLDEAPTLIPEGIDPEKGAEIAATGSPQLQNSGFVRQFGLYIEKPGQSVDVVGMGCVERVAWIGNGIVGVP